EGASGIIDFGKAVTYYDPQLIELQKEFAGQLLGSENPYTGLRVADDPVVGMVEITNENTIYGYWKGDRLRPNTEGGALIPRHNLLLDALWQDFLMDKYSDQETLQNAWRTNAQNQPIQELIADPSFEEGDINAFWELELHESAAGAISLDADEKYAGMFSGKVEVSNLSSEGWHFQFKQEGLSMIKDSSYVVEFYAKSNSPMSLSLGLMRGEDPWTWYGGSGYNVTDEWQHFIFTIVATEDNLERVRLTFNFGNTGTIWFDDFSMRLASKSALNEGENLDNRNIERTLYSQREIYSTKRIADLAEFYINIQRAYFQEMKLFLQEDLAIKVPITGTNALVGPADAMSMVDLDFLDDHAYWDHPRFPNQPWDGYDWFINNESMLKNLSGGTFNGILGGLAMTDRPYTISEYNHAYPNQYQSEMVPLLAAYLSWHDVDGLMFFEYHGGPYDDWDRDYLNGYFSLNRNHSIMSLMPIYSHAYRNGLIDPAPNTIEISYSQEDVYGFHEADNFGRWGKFLPYDQTIAYQQPVKTTTYESETGFDPTMIPEINSNDFQLPQITLNGNSGTLIINTPKIQSLTGFLDENPGIASANITLHQGSGFGQVGLLSLTEQDIQNSEELLLFVASTIQNSNQQWDGLTTVHNNWGSEPTQIKPLNLEVTLSLAADSIHLYQLNTLGETEGPHVTFLPTSENTFDITIDQAIWPTPWLGVKTFDGTTSHQVIESDELKVFPNPANDKIQISWPATFRPEDLLLINGIGQVLFETKLEQSVYGSYDLSVSNLSPGQYVVQVANSDGIIYTRKLLIQ
nr:carbohydrate binding domain-containing protein [Saprospiraceae bacterium]